MKTFSFIQSLVVLLAILTSCQQEKKPDKWEVAKVKRETVKGKLAAKYGITQDMDTIKWRHSIDFQDAPSKIYVSEKATLHDMVRIDSAIYTIIVCNGGYGHTYISLRTSEEQAYKLKKSTGDDVWAFRLKNIRKAGIELNSEVEYDEAYIAKDVSKTFVGTGELIDVEFIDDEE